MLSVKFFCQAECHYAECRYAEYRYAECHGASYITSHEVADIYKTRLFVCFVANRQAQC